MITNAHTPSGASTVIAGTHPATSEGALMRHLSSES